MPEREPDSPAGSQAENAEGAGKRYYRIGEVSKITGVKPHVLRYWESEFRWMTPPKSRTRQRLYRARDIEVVHLIKRLLKEEGFTIAGARKKLRELGVGRALDAGRLDLELDSDPRHSIRRLRKTLETLRENLRS